MATTSNPTPTPTVDADPGGMDIDASGNEIPDRTVPLKTVGIVKPLISGALYTSTVSSVGYVPIVKGSSLRTSAFFNAVPQNTKASPTTQNLFVNVCPGRNSFVKGSVGLAYDMNGSGYYSSSSGAWWSTNFTDPKDAACTMKDGTGQSWGGGPYYSKNTVTGTGNAQYMLTGACTVEGNIIKLIWGVQWGVLTRNAMFDSANSDGSFSTYSLAIPTNADGTVNTAALNTAVMYNCPARGAFVMIDLVTMSFVYTYMDGETYQYAVQGPGALAAGTLAGSVSVRSTVVDDEQVLPLTSSLVGLPEFNSGVVTPHGALTGWTMQSSTAGIDRAHTWIQFDTGYDLGNGTVSAQYSTQADAQADTSAVLVSYNTANGKYNAISSIQDTLPRTSVTMWSPYLAQGTSAQLVGYILPTYGASTFTLRCTSYGWRSVAPRATAGSANASTYMLTSASAQAEIISCFPATVGWQGGFVYDASIGSYGQVTWLSQL